MMVGSGDVGGGTVFTDVHPDIIKSHLLSRLDGPSLASAASCSTSIRQLSSDENLWSHICHSTWPSSSPFIATLGPRFFFSHAYPMLTSDAHPSHSRSPPPDHLISAVDICYKNHPIFTKTQETETLSAWFRCSPFRIDLVEPKDVVPTPIQQDACTEAMNEMTLSWILIDMIGRRVVNLSSHKPVAVQRHWLTRQVQLRYATVLTGHVQFEIVVTCESSGEMHVIKEVCLQVEDMDGMHLNGKDSLAFLQGALEAKKGTGGNNRVQQGHRRYKEYVEMKRARRERKLRAEGVLDTLCVAFGVSIFVAFCCFMLSQSFKGMEWNVD